MKNRLQFGVVMALMASCALSSTAQPLTKARLISRAEIARFAWPRVARLNHGDTNFQFAALQYLLRNQGFYKGAPDGTFDSNFSHPTERAVKRFQRAKGLRADGVVGPTTWQRLLPKIRRGDRGDAVRALQEILDGRKGDGAAKMLGVDGIFGFETERELRQLQRAHQIKVDGIVGAQTWCLLVGGKYTQ